MKGEVLIPTLKLIAHCKQLELFLVFSLCAEVEKSVCPTSYAYSQQFPAPHQTRPHVPP
jgi:hypothetical protein